MSIFIVTGQTSCSNNTSNPTVPLFKKTDIEDTRQIVAKLLNIRMTKLLLFNYNFITISLYYFDFLNKYDYYGIRTVLLELISHNNLDLKLNSSISLKKIKTSTLYSVSVIY
jgi:hypothetical protein